MPKEAKLSCRIDTVLKNRFNQKLKEDGMSESDFLITCVINYLGIETIPKELKPKKKGEKKNEKKDK